MELQVRGDESGGFLYDLKLEIELSEALTRLSLQTRQLPSLQPPLNAKARASIKTTEKLRHSQTFSANSWKLNFVKSSLWKFPSEWARRYFWPTGEREKWHICCFYFINVPSPARRRVASRSRKTTEEVEINFLGRWRHWVRHRE